MIRNCDCCRLPFLPSECRTEEDLTLCFECLDILAAALAEAELHDVETRMPG